MPQEFPTNSPEGRMQKLGYPIDQTPRWPFKLFDPFARSGELVEFSGIPGLNADGTFLKKQYEGVKAGTLLPQPAVQPPVNVLTAEEIVAAGKRAMTLGLSHLWKSEGSLSNFRPFKLQILIGCNPATEGLGQVANELSTFLLQTCGIDPEVAGEKGVRATFGVSMEFAIEPIMTLKRIA